MAQTTETERVWLPVLEATHAKILAYALAHRLTLLEAADEVLELARRAEIRNAPKKGLT